MVNLSTEFPQNLVSISRQHDDEKLRVEEQWRYLILQVLC